MELDSILSSYSFSSVFYGSIALLILVSISLKIKKPSSLMKKVLFTSIAFVVVSVTMFLAGSTIYLNIVSFSKGPVHYHADIEIWNCGKEVELIDPKGLSNKIGTSTLHEHNDKRIHLEGVVMDDKSASLGRFFEVIGGYITPTALSVPTNNGQLAIKADYMCKNGAVKMLQVFAFKVKNGIYYQTKVYDPANYVISPYSNVPPGDCIIIEFDSFKNKTDKLCRSYKVAETIGKIKEGEVNHGN